MSNVRFVYRPVSGWSRRLRQKQVHRFGGLLIVTMIAASSAPNIARSEPTTSEQPVLNISIHDGLLALDVRNVAMASVLEAIGEQAGIIINIHPPRLDQLITLSFPSRPIDEGLKRILGKTTYVMTYREKPAVNSLRSLAELYVSGQSDPGLAQPAQVLNIARTPARHVIDTTNAADKAIALTTDPDAKIRRKAISMLAKFDDPVTHVALINALNDQDTDVQLEALEVVGMLEPQIAIGALEIVRATNKNPVARALAAEILNGMKGPVSTEPAQRAPRRD